MSHTISHEEFLSDSWPGFADEVLEQVLKQSMAFDFDFSHSAVSVSATTPNSSNPSRLAIRGCAPSSFQPWSFSHSRPNLFIPLFVTIKRLAIPSSSLHFFPKSNRSLAVFMISNLVSHIALEKEMEMDLDPNLYQEMIGHPTTEILRGMYFERIRGCFQKEEFQPGAKIELLFADRIFRELDFDSQRLNEDADEVRRLMTSNRNPLATQELANGILSIRTQVLKQCYE